MITISLRSVTIRIIYTAILSIGFSVLGGFVIREAVGSSLIDFVHRHPELSTEAKIENADLALGFSSRNPSVHWVRGGAYFGAANADSPAPVDGPLKIAIDELRKATQLSPRDFRVWLSLGRVLDRTGSVEESRAALDRALQLAPNHFETRWFLGNHLLRAGDREAAFVQMRQALASRPSALPLIFDYAWSIYNGNREAIIAALDPSPEVKAQIVSLLVRRGRVDDGLSIWRQIPSPGVNDVQRVVESLISVGKFAAANDIWQRAEIPSRPEPDPGSLMANGDFEEHFPLNSTVPFFAWQIAPSAVMRVYLDQKDPYEGKQSLRFSFSMTGNAPITLANQTVPVKPGNRYCLSFHVKTDGLESLSTPYVEIFDSADPARASAATGHFPTHSSMWTRYEIKIDTSAATEALTVRLQRQPCSVPPCPIEGRIWFDDFRLNECSEQFSADSFQ